uniref:Uncharacterized protein n=1 Tax=Zea mays TaxID=4577 RepID=A0A804PBG6_MAIZE
MAADEEGASMVAADGSPTTFPAGKPRGSFGCRCGTESLATPREKWNCGSELAASWGIRPSESSTNPRSPRTALLRHWSEDPPPQRNPHHRHRRRVHDFVLGCLAVLRGQNRGLATGEGRPVTSEFVVSSSQAGAIAHRRCVVAAEALRA